MDDIKEFAKYILTLDGKASQPWTTHQTSMKGELLLRFGEARIGNYRQLQMTAADARFASLARLVAPKLARVILKAEAILNGEE